MDKRVIDFNVRLRTIKLRELVIGLIVALIITGIVSAIFPEVYDDDNLFMIVYLLLISLFFGYALKGSRGLSTNFKNLFKDDTKKEILFVLITNLLYAFLVMLLFSALDLLIGLGDPTWVSMWDVDSIDTSSNFILIDALLTIIFAPVLEELIFRGVLFNRLKIRTGIIPAMLISSFLFGIGHDFGGMTSAFLFGLCMCILYLKTDNILVPMSVHFLNNLIVTILDSFYFDSIIGQLPWLIPALIITFIGSVYLVKYIFNESRLLKKQFS